MLIRKCLLLLVGACVLLTQFSQQEDINCVDIQTCLNCARPTSKCTVPALSYHTNVVNGSECREYCRIDLAGQCDIGSFSGTYKECNYFDCTSPYGIEINYESVVYRRTCNTDCDRFEVEYVGTKHIVESCWMSNVNEINMHDCFEECLDTALCRGATLNTNTNTCHLYNCDTLQTLAASSNFITWKKICRPLPPPYVQTCINCVSGPICSEPLYTTSGVTTKDMCSTTCNAENDCAMFVYDRTLEECRFYFCDQVGYDYMAGSIALRKTYYNHCLKFELVRMENYQGDASLAIYLSFEAMQEQTCLKICLATVNCVAMSWTPTSCMLFSGHTTVEAAGVVHYKIYCQDACSYSIQTCLNCEQSASCQGNYNTVTASVSKECNDACMSDNRCETAVFIPSSNACQLYQCPDLAYFHFNDQVNLNHYSTNTVYRKSCNTDCPVFRLQTMVFTNGSCAIIGEEIGDVDMDYCVHRCLDMAACHGVTYDSAPGAIPCLYHSCNSHTFISIASTKTFIWKECDPDCDRTTIQTCTNCGLGDGCSSSFHDIANVVQSSQCSSACSINETCNVGIYNTSGNTCMFSECLKVNYNVYSKTFRSTCSSVCPVYSIHKKFRYMATAIMMSYTQIKSEQECLAICLDNGACRSVAYYYDGMGCFLQNHTDSSYVPSLNTVFYERNCDAGCDRVYTQTCHQCQQSQHCPSEMYTISGGASIEDCFSVPYWMSSIASSVHYDSSTGTCKFYDCVGVQAIPGAEEHELVRKTCLNDCPDYTVETSVGYYGFCENVTNKSFDIEIDAQICLEYCLDTSICRGVNFDTSTSMCYYVTDVCDDINPKIADPNFTYIKVDCNFYFVTQTCNNCGVSNCPSPFTQSTVDSSIECKTTCKQSPTCLSSVYDKTTKQCFLYECRTINQAVSGNNRLFRKSRNSDCAEYELYMNNGYTATSCNVMSTVSSVNDYQQCIEECLDTATCRGVSYDTMTLECSLHSETCSTVIDNANAIYIIKYCSPVCTIPNVQTCENCKAADTCTIVLDETSNNVTKPYNIDTTLLQSDNDVTQMWYNGSAMQYKYLDCPEVKRTTGGSGYDIVHRRSCSSDCLRYEVYKIPGYRGSCNDIDHLFGGVTEETCLSKCIDMAGCRGVTFDFSSSFSRCIFHDCDDNVVWSASNFYRKRCIQDCNSPVTTTCVGCSPTSSCNYYTNTSTKLESTCKGIDSNDTENSLAFFSRDTDSCATSQCPFLSRVNYNMVYRATCNTDCIRYEIFELSNNIGTCSFIEEDYGQELSYEQCVARCLDMTGCWAMTIRYSTINSCQYHSCTTFTPSTVDSPTLFFKRCLDNEPVRNNTQICVGCSHSHLCQRYNVALQDKSHFECEELFTEANDTFSYLYHMDTTRCLITDCHWVTQDIGMNDIAYRKSTTTDCPIYRPYKLYNKQGSCTVIDEDYEVDINYCTNRCLDLDGCRAVTFNSNTRGCVYHNCIGYTDVVDNTIFMWRECMTHSEYSPVKNYTQIIEDGRSDCGEAWDTNKEHPIMKTTINVNVASHCNCSLTGCNNVIYDLSDRKCREYECDRPAPSGFGKTLYRKTFNSQCLNMYMQVLTSSVPGCTEYRIEEGITPGIYCLQLCLDDPLCSTVGLHSTQRMCAFYNCAGTYTTGDMSHLIVKHCIPDCAPYTVQTCVNCLPADICYANYYNGTDTLSNCLTTFDNDTDCKGITHDNSTLLCTLYQCGRVKQQYNSTFYRRTCSTDCPVYEMYTVQGIGSCALFPDMTEEFITDISVCFERCLNTDGCRGVTYIGQTCQYHQCDCFNTTAGSETFIWRYCLNAGSDKTNLTDPSDMSLYPSECLTTTSVAMTSSTAGTTTDQTSPTAGTTTDQTSSTAGTTTDQPTTSAETTIPPVTSSTATTTVAMTSSTAGTTAPPSTSSSSETTVTVTTTSTTRPPMTPIYIYPCLCSTGAFVNLTEDEILAVLKKESLIDADTTSKHLRKLISVPDERKSATSIGFAGVVILSSVIFVMLVLDMGTLMKSVKNLTCKNKTSDSSSRQINRQC